MILPEVRDPRLVTIRRGGTLTDVDHHLLALWVAASLGNPYQMGRDPGMHQPRTLAGAERERSCPGR